MPAESIEVVKLGQGLTKCVWGGWGRRVCVVAHPHEHMEFLHTLRRSTAAEAHQSLSDAGGVVGTNAAQVAWQHEARSASLVGVQEVMYKTEVSATKLRCLPWQLSTCGR